MTSRATHVVAILMALTAAACEGSSTNQTAGSPGPSSPPTTPPPISSPSVSPSAGPSCTPSGTSLEVSTSPSALAFDTKCLAAPGGEAFTIAFHNRSPSVPHDVSIASEGLVDVFFEGKVVTGPADVTYRVKALDPGTYVFYCKVHPTAMNGTFIVQ